MLVSCDHCGKEFDVAEHTDPVMQEMFKNVRRFCSSRCVREALNEHVRTGDAIDKFMAMDSSNCGKLQ